MASKISLLKWSLRAGGLYFLLITAAYLFGLNVSMIFLYFDAPSYAYQDRVIAFLAFGWSLIFFTAAEDLTYRLRLVRTVLIAGGGALAGLIAINIVTNFRDLGQGITMLHFWLETVGILLYWLWLFLLYRKVK